MIKFLYLLLISGCVYAQAPVKSIRKDSIPKERQPLPPDLNESSRMPTARPDNAFYRNPKDGPNIVRATLDNMPIKVPDSSMTYTMPGSRLYPKGPIEPPSLQPKVFPHITPKNH